MSQFMHALLTLHQAHGSFNNDSTEIMIFLGVCLCGVWLTLGMAASAPVSCTGPSQVCTQAIRPCLWRNKWLVTSPGQPFVPSIIHSMAGLLPMVSFSHKQLAEPLHQILRWSNNILQYEMNHIPQKVEILDLRGWTEKYKLGMNFSHPL